VPFSLHVGAGWYDGIDETRWGGIHTPDGSLIQWLVPDRLVNPRTGAKERFHGDAKALIAWYEVRDPTFLGEGRPVVIDGRRGYVADVTGSGPANCRETSIQDGCVLMGELPGAAIRAVIVDVADNVVLFEVSAEAPERLDGVTEALKLFRFR
jgi:hypothetical protein